MDWLPDTIEGCLSPLPLGHLPKLQTKDYRTQGRYPIIDQGQDLIAGWTDDSTGLISHVLPVIVFGDHTRVLKYVDFPFVRGADGTQILKPRIGIDPLYFYYACLALSLPSRGYNRHFAALKESEISLPKESEQIVIGAALRLIEGYYDLQRKQFETAKLMKTAAMRTVFTRGLRGESQKETDIGLVPESWDVVEFKTVRELLQYGTSVHCTYQQTAYPVLRIPNIETGGINTNDMKFCNLRPDEAARYRLVEGDLIFIRTNGVIERLGACAVYAGAPPDTLFASYLIRARLNLNRINPYFAAQFFGSELGTRIVAGRATPASDGKYNLNTGTIDGLPISVPPTLDEQDQIVATLGAIDLKIDIHRRKRILLDKLFKALLHKLMSGDVSVYQIDLSALSSAAAADVAA